MYLYMHNKTVKRRVNQKKGGSPPGTKRKRIHPSPSPGLPSIKPSLQEKAKHIESEERKIYRLLPKKKQKIYVEPDTTSIPNPTNDLIYTQYEDDDGPAIASEYISDSDVSVYSDESSKPPSGPPLFVRRPYDSKKSTGDSKKRKDVGYKKGKHVDVIVSMDDSSIGKQRRGNSPVEIKRSKEESDLPDRRVRRITAKKQKPGSLPNISKKAPIFSNPKNVPKPPPQKIFKAPKSSVPPQPPKKLPKRIVALRLYNYYRDKTIPNNKKDPNHYFDYICHIRCKDGFMYTIDSDVDRTIISNGPVEFDFSYKCQHVPFSIRREGACKMCSRDFEVNADYFKYLEDHTQRHKGNEKKKYLEYVNSLTKEEDIYEFFLSTGNVIEFLTDESDCHTTDVTYLDEEIGKATVNDNYYQIIERDYGNIVEEDHVFKSDSLNIKLRYK